MTGYRWLRTFNDEMRGVTINTRVSANTVANTVEKLAKAHGEVTPEMFLDASRPKNSKTHKLFNWDDTEAAERYRLEQARLALRNFVYTVTIRDAQGEEQQREVRGTASIRSLADSRKRVYQVTSRVMETQIGRDEVIQDCLNQLKRWRRKWFIYNELVQAVDLTNAAVEALEEALANSTASASKEKKKPG